MSNDEQELLNASKVAFDTFASKFDTFGNEWQDMAADRYFSEGFLAGHAFQVPGSFGWAVARMLEGKCVRRKCWAGDQWIKIDADRLNFYQYQGYPWSVTASDTMATDWEALP